MDVDLVAGVTENAMEMDPDPFTQYDDGVPKLDMYHGRQLLFKTFLDIYHKCGTCDRLWFKNDLKSTNSSITDLLGEDVHKEDAVGFMLWESCKSQCSKRRIPEMSRK